MNGNALYVCSVMGWDVASCVSGMAFKCGRKIINEPLLQAGMVAISPQMFKSKFKPLQTSIQTMKSILRCVCVSLYLT